MSKELETQEERKLVVSYSDGDTPENTKLTIKMLNVTLAEMMMAAQSIIEHVQENTDYSLDTILEDLRLSIEK